MDQDDEDLIKTYGICEWCLHEPAIGGIFYSSEVVDNEGVRLCEDCGNNAVDDSYSQDPIDNGPITYED